MKRVISLIFLFLVLSLVLEVKAQAPGIIQSNTLLLKEEGSNVGRVKSIDCVGTGITCTSSGINGTVTISAGGAAYDRIQDEGTNLTQRTTLDFTGAGVSCADTGTKTQCTIGSGGGGLTHPEVMSRISLGF